MTKKFILLGILGIFSLVVLVVLGYFLLQPYYRIWKMANQLEKVEKELIEYFKKDIYGGRTPEETYHLYLTALKKGNLEEASKYHWWTKQEKEKERLKKLKQENKLQEHIESFPKWEELEEEEGDGEEKRYVLIKNNPEPETVKLPDGRGGYIETTFPPGDYIAFSVAFYLNKYANIWKIY